MIADRIIAWSLAFALAFFPTIASVRMAQALSPQEQLIMLHQQPAPSGGGGGSLSYTFTSANFANGTPAPPQAFSGMAIGTASADRIVVVTIAVQGAPAAGAQITSVTVDPGGGPISLALAASSGGGAVSGRGDLIWWGFVTGAGSTATVTISGYSNGFVNGFALNVGVIKGSATASIASVIQSVPPGYSSGGTPTAITVPANGVSIISTYSDNDAPVGGVTTTYNGAAADNDESNQATFILTGSVFHQTTSTTMTVASTTSSGFGWVAANFQP